MANISMDDKLDMSNRDKLCVNHNLLEARSPGTPRVSLTYYTGSPHVGATYYNASIPSLDSLGLNKNRRSSTIHSYNLVNYHALPQRSTRTVRDMTERKALKNIIVLGLAFMFVHTGFISILSLQSIMNPEGGVGLASISCIYATTVLSCVLAPFIINTISMKWTMIVAFILFTGYFAGNFCPKDFTLIPIGLLLGVLGGPLMTVPMTYVTTVALTYSQHADLLDQETVVNKYMAIFCAFHRSSYIWGNLITTLMLSNNQTLTGEDTSDVISGLNSAACSRKNVTLVTNCGAMSCEMDYVSRNANRNDVNENPHSHEITIPDGAKYMLLSIYIGCGVMSVVIVMALLDKNVGTKRIIADLNTTTKELFLATLIVMKDIRCILLVPLVVFIGLEQGFIFGDFTKSFVNCTMGIYNIGPIMMCFGGVSALASLVISCISKHIKRFAFITAGATFNFGLLVVLWLWKPVPGDVPNFFVVSACLGLCDAIWQTQTYTLFGILFIDKQEAAFAAYRMFYATGCALSFGYSFFLCVQTKVYILAAMLTLSLLMYSVIEMKVQLQSQHLKDIVAF